VIRTFIYAAPPAYRMCLIHPARTEDFVVSGPEIRISFK
jgi:hypothetical protein